MLRFRWNSWNIWHIAEHGITVSEAEYVADHPLRPYPAMIGDEKRIVVGKTGSGRIVQVVYINDDNQDTVYIIHARELTDNEKRRYRRRSR